MGPVGSHFYLNDQFSASKRPASASERPGIQAASDKQRRLCSSRPDLCAPYHSKKAGRIALGLLSVEKAFPPKRSSSSASECLGFQAENERAEMRTASLDRWRLNRCGWNDAFSRIALMPKVCSKVLSFPLINKRSAFASKRRKAIRFKGTPYVTVSQGARRKTTNSRTSHNCLDR